MTTNPVAGLCFCLLSLALLRAGGYSLPRKIKSGVPLPFKRFVFFAAVLFGLAVPTGAAAAPMPLDPIEVESSGQISESVPHIAPDGGQIVAFRTLRPGGLVSVLIERSNGGPFSDQIDLTDTVNAENPSLSFPPDGGIYAIWGVGTNGATAEQTFRLPGGEFGAATGSANCTRFVDSAAGPDGGIAVVCSHTEATNPPNTYWLGSNPSLGPVPVTEQLNPPAYDSFMRPRVAWGADGTLAVVADYWISATNPPPANQTKRVRATIRNSAEGVFATVDFPNVTQPAEINVNGGPAVLNDGTVAFSTGGTAGAVVQILPSGATAFSPQVLTGDAATEPQVDAAQNLHVMSVAEGPPRQYLANVRPPGGSFGTPVPIPLAGAGDPYIPYDGFRVAPDGTEYAVIRASDGIYATSRSPGQASFETPSLLGSGDATNNPEVAVTSEGDLLASWPIEVAPGDFQLFVGGLDKTPPKVTVTSFPVQATTGAALSFSAEASDNMGLRSVGWDFGDGTVAGDTATSSFGPGRHPVSFTATDRAGNETAVSRTVRVPGLPGKGTPTMKVVTPKRLKFRTLARRGLKVKVRSNLPLRIKSRIATSRQKLRKKPLRTRSVKTLKRRHVLRVKPKKKRLGKRRNLKLFVRVTGTTAKGKSVTRIKKVKIRR